MHPYSAREPAERIDIPVTAVSSTQPIREAEQAPAPALPTAEQWLAANPNWTSKDNQRQSSGAVLYVAPDGRWLQKLGRGNVAIRPPAEFSIQVGDVIDYRNGKSSRVAPAVGKGRGE